MRRSTDTAPDITVPSNSELLDVLLTIPGSTLGEYSRFHSYSPRNRAWFYWQGITPQPVATFKGWQTVGRQVTKGSRAKYVLRPITIPEKDDSGEKTGKSFTRFKPVKAIFALSDTEGEALPPMETPEWKLERALGALGIKQVPFRDFDGDVHGYSYERNMAVSEVATHPLKTAFHELGHIVLGHTVASKMAEYATHRGLMEFQAEATAYLTAHELDALDERSASSSRAYVQGWLQGAKPSEAAIGQVFAAHDEVLRAGLPDRNNVEAVA